MKVEDLSIYDEALEMPKEDLRKQKKILHNLLRKKFGVAGHIKIMIDTKRHTKRIYAEYPEAIENVKKFPKVIIEQPIMLGALFCSIADKKGRKFSKVLMTTMFQKIASVSLPAHYQLNKLIKCEGDVFENFKKHNRALFSQINKTGTRKIIDFHETEDLLEFKVIKCMHAELFKEIGCPELCTLGCDFGLAGYPLIEDAMHCEFRRPCTLAKGGNYCHFFFYRKDKAPKTAYLNQ